MVVEALRAVGMVVAAAVVEAPLAMAMEVEVVVAPSRQVVGVVPAAPLALERAPLMEATTTASSTQTTTSFPALRRARFQARPWM